jgi:AraC family transcriptional regulator
MSQLLSNQAGFSARHQIVLGERSETFLTRVIVFIEEHLVERFTLRELALEAGVSPFHFVRIFKQKTGLTPHQYVMSRRVARAQRLLEDGELPIATIAAETGFASQSHLTELFRREVGVTPRAYRETWGAPG